MEKNIRKSFSFSRYSHRNWLTEIVSINKRVLAIGTQCVGKQS